MGNNPKVRERLIEDYLDRVQMTGDIGEALRETGRSYDSWKRTLKDTGHLKEAEDLAEWKRADTERLTYALGIQWQREKTAAAGR